MYKRSIETHTEKKAIDNGVGDSVIAVQCLKYLFFFFLKLSVCQAAEIGSETRLK